MLCLQAPECALFYDAVREHWGSMLPSTEKVGRKTSGVINIDEEELTNVKKEPSPSKYVKVEGSVKSEPVKVETIIIDELEVLEINLEDPDEETEAAAWEKLSLEDLEVDEIDERISYLRCFVKGNS